MADDSHQGFQILKPAFRPPPTASSQSDLHCRPSGISTEKQDSSSMRLTRGLTPASFYKNRHTPNIIFSEGGSSPSAGTRVERHSQPAQVTKDPFHTKSGSFIDPSRAGLPSSLRNERRNIKVVPNLAEKHDAPDRPRITKKVFHGERRTDPIAQLDGTDPNFNYVRRPSIKHIGNTFKQTQDDQSHFKRRGKPQYNPISSSKIPTQPVSGGGFIPEDARPGLRTKTVEGYATRPKDNADVIQYKHAGKINEPVRIEREAEQQKYYKAFKETARSNATVNSDMYHYFRARTMYTSPSLTDFLYEERNPK